MKQVSARVFRSYAPCTNPTSGRFPRTFQWVCPPGFLQTKRKTTGKRVPGKVELRPIEYRTDVRYNGCRGVAPMVFCKECRQKVEECPHFVAPLAGERLRVIDEKIETLAYSDRDRILEIA